MQRTVQKDSRKKTLYWQPHSTAWSNLLLTMSEWKAWWKKFTQRLTHSKTATSQVLVKSLVSTTNSNCYLHTKSAQLTLQWLTQSLLQWARWLLSTSQLTWSQATSWLRSSLTLHSTLTSTVGAPQAHVLHSEEMVITVSTRLATFRSCQAVTQRFTTTHLICSRLYATCLRAHSSWLVRHSSVTMVAGRLSGNKVQRLVSTQFSMLTTSLRRWTTSWKALRTNSSSVLTTLTAIHQMNNGLKWLNLCLTQWTVLTSTSTLEKTTRRIS